MSLALVTFAGIPVPFTASWTAEGATFVGHCPYAKMPAICQHEARGSGRPRFAKPHFGRQRQVIVEDRCDLCARSLAHRTKVSLSHARIRGNGVTGADLLQVEPLLHAECAAVCIQHCPSLKRDLASGTFEARVVTRHRVQIAIANPVFIAEYVPGYVAAPGERISAHAKVDILQSRVVSAAWVEGKA